MIAAIIQARTGSTRLPGKVLMKLKGKEVLIHVIDRVLMSKVDLVVVATTTSPGDDAIARLVEDYSPKVRVFRGSEEDVLDRYYQAAKKFRADVIVRVTADCPMIDWEVINRVIDALCGNDYASNVMPRTYPRGLDCEAFTFRLLELMAKNCKSAPDREHVSLYARNHANEFRTSSVTNSKDLSAHRWTLDELPDYEFMEAVFSRLGPMFPTKDVLDLLGREPNLADINKGVKQK